jgi:predicted MFS family arabinose efflux permease
MRSWDVPVAMTPERSTPVSYGGELASGSVLLIACMLGAAAGLSSLGYYSVGMFILPLQQEFSWSRGEIASSMLVSTVVMATLFPLLGLLIDRFGSRVVALISIPLFALALFALSRTPASIGAYYGLCVLASVAGLGTTPVNYTRAVNAEFSSARGLALGITLAGMGVAAIGLPLFLTFVIGNHGWRSGYVALAALALLPWPFVYFGLPRERQVPRGVGPVIDRRAALRSPVLWTMMGSFAAVTVAASALIIHLLPLLRDAGLAPARAAGVVSLLGVGIVIGRLGMGFLIDRMFAPRVAAAAFAATAAGCALLGIAGPEMAPVAALTIGFAMGAEIDVISYLTARYFGLASYGFVYSLLYSMVVVSASVGPALAGLAFDAAGGYAPVLWTAAGLLTLGALGVLCLPRFDPPAG